MTEASITEQMESIFTKNYGNELHDELFYVTKAVCGAVLNKTKTYLVYCDKLKTKYADNVEALSDIKHTVRLTLDLLTVCIKELATPTTQTIGDTPT